MKSKKEHIVCVAFPKWEGDYMKSTVQLMSELSKDYHILYVDYPYTWKDGLRGMLGKNKTPLGRMLGMLPSLQKKQLENGNDIHLLTLPPFIPANWTSVPFTYERLLKWNSQLAMNRIRAAMAQLGINQPVVVNAFSPALGVKLAGHLNEKLLVYYCYDEISATVWAGKHGSRYEQQFLKQADLTIVSSEPLYRAKVEKATDCALVKNGVGPIFFKQPGERPADMPKAENGAIIGYLGSVDERLDYDLLSFLASSLKLHQFVFIGRIVDEKGAAKIRQLPNVHLLGSKPIQQLHDYVNALDVGLIPFVKNKLTAGIYPLKINEYLAMGKPVVATDFTDLSDFESIIHIAKDEAAFRYGIAAALSKDNSLQQEARRAVARKNAWAQRAEEFSAQIEKALLQKKTINKEQLIA